MRDAAINLRARPEQRDLIDHAAQLLGKNRSDFMLEAACSAAQTVMLDQVFFSMEPEKFHQFTALLRSGLIKDMLCAFSEERNTFWAFAELGENVCGHPRTTHGGELERSERSERRKKRR